MPASLLGLRVSGAGAIELLQYVGATVTAAGTTFSTADSANIQHRPLGRAIQAFGDVYVTTFDGLYKKDDPSVLAGTFTLIGAFTGAAANYIGPVARVFIGGVPYLTGVFKTGAFANWTGWKYNLLTSTFTTYTGLTGGNTNHLNEFVVYRNKLYMRYGLTTSADVWDPESETMTTIAGLAAEPGCAFCVADDKLFATVQTTTTEARTRVLSGGSFVDFGATPNFSHGNASSGKSAMFALANSFITITLDVSGQDGLAAYETDFLGNRTDITNTVIPDALKAVARGGSFAGSITALVCRVVVDVSTDPLNPEILFYYAASTTTGTPWSVYQWNGTGSVMTVVDTGGDVDHALPFTTVDGGSRIWTPGELDADFVARADDLGAERVDVRTWGAVGPTDKTIAVFFNKKGSSDLTLATLAGPVTGGSAALNGGNNGLINIEANPLVDYSFLVPLAPNGISVGERVQYYVQVSA